MSLPMSRPWKHPATGVYWFRKGVPECLRALVGKREEKISLRTKDPAEAKVRHAKISAEVELRWSNLRLGRRTLSEKEAHAMAGEMHHHCLELFSENPSQGFWDSRVGATLWADVPIAVEQMRSLPEWEKADPDFFRRKQIEEWCRSQALKELSSRGIEVDTVGQSNLARAIGAALQNASLKLKMLSDGHYDGDVASTRKISSEVGGGSPTKAETLGFDELFSGWSREKRPGEKTEYSWKRVLDQLGEFVGHRDAAQLTPEDFVRWKNGLIEAGLKGKTIRDSKIAPVRAVLQWAVDNRRLKARAESDHPVSS